MPDPLVPGPDGLIPAAMRAPDSRGRRFAEPEHAFRNPYQRDRDRVIHAAAFRRLEYKTQVFVNGEGDHYRTRLTHTLEVTQIARTVARALGLNEDLTEAVALSHDLGHTPFGHGGERKLNELLRGAGGFDHNSHGLRVVDLLEKRYAAFPGLNLTYEVREAFVRHGGPAVVGNHPEFAPGDAPLLEVAATLAADDIAYLAHDIDDGLYSRILREEDLEGVELWRRAAAAEGFAGFSPSLKRVTGIRRVIDLLATDLIATSRRNILEGGYDSPERVRAGEGTPIALSSGMEVMKEDLKRFLYANLYRHPAVMTVVGEAQDRLAAVFRAYVNRPERMPGEYRDIAGREGVVRAAADYVAGMTDRFAGEEYLKYVGG